MISAGANRRDCESDAHVDRRQVVSHLVGLVTKIVCAPLPEPAIASIPEAFGSAVAEQHTCVMRVESTRIDRGDQNPTRSIVKQTSKCKDRVRSTR